MISPFDMYSASTLVIAMKPIGCLRFPECPRAGRAGRLVFFKGQKAVPWTRANPDAASQAREVCSDLTVYSATRSSSNRVHADERGAGSRLSLPKWQCHSGPRDVTRAGGHYAGHMHRASDCQGTEESDQTEQGQCRKRERKQ